MIRSFRRVACHGLVVFFFRPSQLGQCRFQRISSHSLSLSLCFLGTWPGYRRR